VKECKGAHIVEFPSRLYVNIHMYTTRLTPVYVPVATQIWESSEVAPLSLSESVLNRRLSSELCVP
jgi:hypothetical protein